MALQSRAVGDADQIGAERTAFALISAAVIGCLNAETITLRPSSSAAAKARSLRCCCRYLNSCSCRATMPCSLPARPNAYSSRLGLRSPRRARGSAIAFAERDLFGRLFRDASGRRQGARDSRCRPDRPRDSADNRRTSRRRATVLARSRTRRASAPSLFPAAWCVDEALEELQDLREAELLRLGGASALVDAEMQHRIGRAGMQAAAAGLADTDLLGHRPVGLKLELGQNAGQIDARTEFGRQDIDLEPERAEPGFDAEMARAQAAVAGALIVQSVSCAAVTKAGRPASSSSSARR